MVIFRSESELLRRAMDKVLPEEICDRQRYPDEPPCLQGGRKSNGPELSLRLPTTVEQFVELGSKTAQYGTFFDVWNTSDTTTVEVTALVAGAHNDSCTATLYVCTLGQSDGHERDLKCWREVARGDLSTEPSKPSTLTLKPPVVLEGGAVQGFMLHGSGANVMLGAENATTHDDLLEMRPWWCTAASDICGKYQLSKHSPAGILRYKECVTHDGAMVRQNLLPEPVALAGTRLHCVCIACACIVACSQCIDLTTRNCGSVTR